MSGFDEQGSWSGMEVEIVDLQPPNSGINLIFFSLGKMLSIIARKHFNHNARVFVVLSLILLVVVLLPGSSLVASQDIHAQLPKSTYSSSEQFEACGGFISVTPNQVVGEQSSTLSSAPPSLGKTVACNGQSGVQIQITVLPMPQNNRNHNP